MGLRRGLRQCLHISPRLAAVASSRSTATARTSRRRYLKARSESLVQSDVVIGPTHDGGYYLVGATASHPGLFAGDGLGTTNAYEALLARVRALGLSVSLTDAFYDVDVADDLSRLASDLERAPARAPRTAQWLMEWRKAMPPEQSGGER